MKALIWVIIGALGFGLMFAAYSSRERLDPGAPWASGVVIMSTDTPTEKSAPAGAIPARLRLLSSSDVAEVLLIFPGDEAPDKGLGVKGQVRVKLI